MSVKGLASVLLALQLVSTISCQHSAKKRSLPTNEDCDPFAGTCSKGDWVSRELATCEYHGHKQECKPQEELFLSWVVEKEIQDQCRPVEGKTLICGAPGTDTRCVCSSPGPYNFFFRREYNNKCKCQYWPERDVHPKSCTGYYAGGKTTVHHWACCNNCGERGSGDCDGKEWQGGSNGDYCGKCGLNTGGGMEKYYFDCGGCSNQKACEKSCKYFNLPLFCWFWLDCFKKCCERSTLI